MRDSLQRCEQVIKRPEKGVHCPRVCCSWWAQEHAWTERFVRRAAGRALCFEGLTQSWSLLTFLAAPQAEWAPIQCSVLLCWLDFFLLCNRLCELLYTLCFLFFPLAPETLETLEIDTRKYAGNSDFAFFY